MKELSKKNWDNWMKVIIIDIKIQILDIDFAFCI